MKQTTTTSSHILSRSADEGSRHLQYVGNRLRYYLLYNTGEHCNGEVPVRNGNQYPLTLFVYCFHRGCAVIR